MSKPVIIEAIHENMFRFRYCGSGYGLIDGHDLTGKTLMDIPFRPLGAFLCAEYLSVIRGQKAKLITYGYYSKGEFIELETGRRLPLSDNGCSITGTAPVDVTIGGLADARDALDDMIKHKVQFKSS